MSFSFPAPCVWIKKILYPHWRTTAGVTCFSCACAVNTSREGRLTWHSGLIPQRSNRGDKGMKTSFQICNVPHPNSYKIFSIFDAGNTATNLLAPFRPQVNSRERDMAVCMLMPTSTSYALLTGTCLPMWRLCLSVSHVWPLRSIWCVHRKHQWAQSAEVSPIVGEGL